MVAIFSRPNRPYTGRTLQNLRRWCDASDASPSRGRWPAPFCLFAALRRCGLRAGTGDQWGHSPKDRCHKGPWARWRTGGAVARSCGGWTRHLSAVFEFHGALAPTCQRWSRNSISGMVCAGGTRRWWSTKPAMAGSPESFLFFIGLGVRFEFVNAGAESIWI